MQTPIQTSLPQVAQQAASQQAVIAGQGRVASLPPTLAQALGNGATLAGQVTARPAAGQLSLTTPAGTLQVQTNLPIPQNSAVSLQLLSAGPPATLQIQTLPAAQASGAATGGAAGTATGSASSAPSAGPSVVTSLTQGTIVQATVVSQAAQSAATGTAQVSAGTPAATAPGPAANTGAQAVANPTGGAPIATAQPAPLAVSSSIPIRILELALPGQGSLSGTGAGGTSFAGTVVAGSTGVQSVLQTAIGNLSLATSQTLPEGTQILFELAGSVRAPVNAGAAYNLQRWEGLKEAMSLLQQGNPAAAQQILQSVIPQPGPQMGAAMLFFMSALRGGGMERLFGGDGARAIDKAGGKGALSRADGDLSGAVGRARDGGGAEWRAYSLPMQQGGDLENIRLYVRGEREDDEESAEPNLAKAKRFIIEANFSRLGPFQFDGLARNKQIDLMVRTHQPLPDGMRDDIRALFADTTSALGMTGRADFHVVKQFDVQFEEEAGSPSGVLV